MHTHTHPHTPQSRFFPEVTRKYTTHTHTLCTDVSYTLNLTHTLNTTPHNYNMTHTHILKRDSLTDTFIRANTDTHTHTRTLSFTHTHTHTHR
jgi:hypothetical protein